MFFFIKPSVIHLDCFTTDSRVHKFYPIAPSSQFLPEWWKKLPKTYKNQKIWGGAPTMKSCSGFIEYYKNSISIPMWCDFVIDIGGKGQGFRWQFADYKTNADVHDIDQYKDFMDIDEYTQFKITSPWYIKTNRSIKWMWSHPVWNYHEPGLLTVLPAIIDFKYNHSTHINAILTKSNKRIVNITQGVPIVNLVPMSDKRVKVHNYLLTEDEFQKQCFAENLEAYHLNKNPKNIRDVDAATNKCPFGFGKK